MMAFPFKLQHNIDHVLKHLGSCQRTLFGDVANEKNRDLVLLGKSCQCRRGFPNLTD